MTAHNFPRSPATQPPSGVVGDTLSGASADAEQALVNGADKSSPPIGFDPSRGLKSVYFDQTVRALEEMIANEREWLASKLVAATQANESDVLYAYSEGLLREAHQRSARLATLASIHGMMTRGLGNSQ